MRGRTEGRREYRGKGREETRREDWLGETRGERKDSREYARRLPSESERCLLLVLSNGMLSLCLKPSYMSLFE